MRSTRRRAFFLFTVIVAGLSACNAITGEHTRFLDNGEADDGGGINRDTGGGDSDVITDAPIDKGPIGDGGNEGGPLVIEVDVAGNWTSPNATTFATIDGGKRIDNYDGSANNHPVIVPLPQPSIPSDDYTVTATIRAASSGSPQPADGGAFEWGILTRVQSSGAGIVLSSSFGTVARPFLGSLPSTDWNPVVGSNGTDYTYVAGEEYKLKVTVQGSDVRAKFWRATDAEPAASLLWGSPPFTTGRGVGFYTYGLNDAILEKMTITVP